jgi:type II secretory pathway component GspD/PulD (secretin)
MKKIAHLMLLAGTAGLLAAKAHADVTLPPNWTSANLPAVSITTNPAVAQARATPPVTTVTTVTTTSTNAVAVAVQIAPAAASAPSTSVAVPVAVAVPVPAPMVVAVPVAAPVAVPVVAPDAATAAVAAATPDSNIPLIQFSDVPITTAIENLARQGGINYMLDPKIGYGMPDQNGQVKPEPQLSIRWENISAQNALLALLDNYGLQLILDKKTGIYRVTMKDPTAPPILLTRVVQLQYASVSNMVDSVTSVFTDKRSRVIADRRTSQLVVVATDSEQQAVDTLIAQLDRQTKQVLIETKLIEISSQPTTKKGVDWTGTLSAQHVTFGNGNITGNTTINNPSTTGGTTPGGGFQTGSSSSSASSVLTQTLGNGGFSASTLAGLIPATGFLNADGVSAVISFLNSSADAQIMSTPRIVTLDNETANLEVTRQYPVINFGGGTANNSGSSSVTYSNVGTILQVTPRISANNKIWLKVVPEVSSHFGDVQITVPGGSTGVSSTFPVPIFDVRKITTQVLIPNGNTLVMGGLVQDNPSATYSKVPFLGDIPGLGWAFRSEDKSMDKDNLIIFLTPTIVEDTDFRPNPTDYLQSKPITMKSPMNPNTDWDGAQPRGNWSNPIPPAPGEFDSNSKLNNF